MLTDVSFTHLAVASISSLVFIVVYYAVQWTRHEIRIRKTGGTRVHTLANDPITGKPSFGEPREEDGVRLNLKPAFLTHIQSDDVVLRCGQSAEESPALEAFQ